jgi:hypothetical protein
MKLMMWMRRGDGCCRRFNEWAAHPDGRGISVVSLPGEGSSPLFAIQARAVDAAHERTPIDAPFPVVTKSTIHISHCPWCGRKLSRYHRRPAPVAAT